MLHKKSCCLTALMRPGKLLLRGDRHRTMAQPPISTVQLSINPATLVWSGMLAGFPFKQEWEHITDQIKETRLRGN